jgi:hypothetical protein
MSKWTVEAEFSLTTDIEPDGIQFDEGDSEEFEDNSYFGGESITSYGGSISFVIEAADEYEAEAKAADVIGDGGEVTDYNSLTWLIGSVSYAITKQEIPMTLERAREILARLVETVRDEQTDDADEIGEAVAFILKTLAEQSTRINELATQVLALMPRDDEAQSAA